MNHMKCCLYDVHSSAPLSYWAPNIAGLSTNEYWNRRVSIFFFFFRTSGNLEQLPDEDGVGDQSEEPTEAQQIFAEIYSEDSEQETAPVWVGPDDVCGGTSAQADVEVLATGPSLPVPTAQSRKRKQQRQFKNEIAELSRVISTKPDEAEYCGLLLAAKIRRCPERLRDEMQMALLRVANEFLEQANRCLTLRIRAFGAIYAGAQSF